MVVSQKEIDIDAIIALTKISKVLFSLIVSFFFFSASQDNIAGNSSITS